MTSKTLDIELGELFSTGKASKYFGRSADEVRRMCVDGEIKPVVVTTGPRGGKRYWIPENTIRAWRREHLQR